MEFRNWFGEFSISTKALAKYQGLASFLKLFKGYSPFPLNIDLALTLRCNLACSFCVCRQEDNVNDLSTFRGQELSPTEWMDIVKDISSSFFFRPNLNLLGGEPSVYKGYLDIVASIKQQGFRCSYTTNGTFLARDAEVIVSAGVDIILISLDGPREICDSIRGSGVFENIVKGIQTINELKRAQGKKVPQLFLTCVISGDNHGHLAHLIDVAKELDINYINFLHLQFPDSEIGMHDIDVSILLEEMAKAKSKAAENNIAANFYPHLRTDQIATYYLQPSERLGKGCISPWIRMIIMPNGKIVPCKRYVVGDARIDGTAVRSVWNNNKFRTFRQGLARNGIFPDCGRCCRKQC